MRKKHRMKKLLFRFWKGDAKRKISWIRDYIEKGNRILDIGSGAGWVTHYLLDCGYDVSPVDIEDLSISHDARPRIYDGKRLPFTSDAFDVALILTVLHHTGDPVSIIMEAARVSTTIVIIEDIYHDRFMEIVTKAADSLTNLHFRRHPHSNRNDKGWRKLFDALDLKVVHSQVHRVGGLIIQAVYVLASGQPPGKRG